MTDGALDRGLKAFSLPTSLEELFLFWQGRMLADV